MWIVEWSSCLLYTSLLEEVELVVLSPGVPTDLPVILAMKEHGIQVRLNEMFGMLGCQRLWWLGGINSPQPPCSRWPRLLAMGAPDSPVRHQTPTVHCPVLRPVS